MVYEIKKNNKNLEIIINGGITNSEQINEHLKYCDGVMIGQSYLSKSLFLSRN